MLIPEKTQRVEYTQSNSRFIATAARADSAEAAKSFIQSIREEMPGANHHVYAYVIGHGASVTEGMSDDGEPAGTSGPPVLAVVRGSGVGDVVVVVTRYFGGTKLGTGGLVTAYKSAAKEVMESLPTAPKIDWWEAACDAPYADHETIKHAVADHDGEILSEDFGAEVTMRFRVPAEKRQAFLEDLANRFNGRIPPGLKE